MARIKYFNQKTGKWEYADSQFTVPGTSENDAEEVGTELSELWAALSALQSKAYTYPVMAASLNWWTSPYLKANVTAIRIVDSYSPTGTEEETFAADVDRNGSIMTYRIGTEVIIAGNGSGKIRLNANSSGVFFQFEKLTSITGLDVFDASEVTNMAMMFYNAFKLKAVDISSWKTPVIKDAYSMFRYCYDLETVKLPAYGFAPKTTRLMFENCHTLREVDFGRGLTALRTEDFGEGRYMSNTFFKCYNLEKVTGLGAVTEIGKCAFCYTPKVTTDLRPERITSIDASAFRLSGAERKTSMAVVPVDAVGDKATRHARWSTSMLSAIQSISGTSTFYDVPNSENQHNYDNQELWTLEDGTIGTVGATGCSTLTMYHIWQALHSDSPYANYAEWFTAEVEPFETFKTNVFSHDTMKLIIERLGWTCDESYTYVTSAEQKETILDRLSVGKPTFASMSSVNFDGEYHAVAIIGYDKDTDRLSIIDSAVSGASGITSWVAFEDIFSGESSADGNYDYIWLFEYGE